MFRLERFTEVREFTYLGKHFPCVNANWYFGKCRKRQKKFDQGKSCNYPVIRHGYSWSRGEQIVRLSRFRPSVSIIADKTRQQRSQRTIGSIFVRRTIRQVKEGIVFFIFSIIYGHAHTRLARLVFFKAIWSKTIRFRLDLLRCCNINILRNLDVSVCGSWIKK